jgi:cytochrome bd-type quinol oxidase subunit 2
VSCTPGCPLPPYESPSPADLVHAAASASALTLAAIAMLLMARASDCHERLCRVSRVCARVTVPLLAAAGLAMLIVGRGYVTGVLERMALVASLAWLAWASLVVRVRS